jgi:PBS lyase HEAT-like repeat
MRSSQKNSIVLFSLAVVLLLASWAESGQSAGGYAGLLETAVRKAETGRAGFNLVHFSVNFPSEPRFAPISGLDDRDAVPFLIDVLRGESEWTTADRFRDKESVYAHIARCYAALSLGAIADGRALAPLVEALAAPDVLDGLEKGVRDDRQRYPLSKYAALGLGYLGDPDAVDPLLRVLPSSGSEYEFFAYAFALLTDVRGVRPLIQHASREAKLSRRVHRCLEDLCRAGFRIQYLPGRHTYRVEDFPELGELEADKVYLVLWQHWDREGPAFAKKQFETYYPIWQRLKRERPQDVVSQRRLLSEIIRAGLPSLPHIMDQVEKGDDSLLPAVNWFRQNARGRADRGGRRRILPLQESISRSECLEWWQDNQDRYEAFLGVETKSEREVQR